MERIYHALRIQKKLYRTLANTRDIAREEHEATLRAVGEWLERDYPKKIAAKKIQSLKKGEWPNE